jgi:hypothetical protein
MSVSELLVLSVAGFAAWGNPGGQNRRKCETCVPMRGPRQTAGSSRHTPVTCTPALCGLVLQGVTALIGTNARGEWGGAAALSSAPAAVAEAQPQWGTQQPVHHSPCTGCACVAHSGVSSQKRALQVHRLNHSAIVAGSAGYHCRHLPGVGDFPTQGQEPAWCHTPPMSFITSQRAGFEPARENPNGFLVL